MTPYVFYLSVFASLLWRYSGQSEMLIGTPAGGRLDEKLRDAIGYFANSLTVRVRCGAQANFRDLTQQVRATVARVMDLQELPFPVVVRELGLARDPSRSPLFQAFFVWDETSSGAVAKVDAERQLVPLSLSQRGSAFDLTLTVFHVAGEASLRLQYNTDLFSSGFIAEVLGHFETLTRSAIRAPQTALGKLDLLSAASVDFITHQRNDTRRATCGELPVHRLFEARATERPEALAITAQGVRVSYGELNRRANAIARLLQRATVHAGDAVAVCMERGAEMIAAILAVWKIGACYVAIDASHPEERVQRILSSSRATAALVQPSTQHRFRWPLAPIAIDANLQLCTDFDSVPQALLAYVMYTSGSTGEPKGVEVLHRGVVNCLEHFRVALNLTERDVWLAITTITFDISVLELFAPLVSGGTVHIADAQAVYEPKRLLELVAQSKATVLQATPAGWATLIASDMPRFEKLQLLCGGEACPRDLADALLERGHCVWNVYGPTETTIWSSAGRIRAGAQPVSAGSPIANTRLYVLDATEQLVPDQVPGELYIAGDGLARGYRGQPELGASQFKTIHIPHVGTERVYRTGDRARWNDRQELEILGRSDRQLKVNGHRIEPTEIEAALRRHPDLLDAVVDRSADSRLVAYLVPTAAGRLPSSDELSQFLRGSLAHYMIPNVFVGIEAVPRSLAGKVDRNALPSIDAAIARQLKGEPPSNETERTLLEIWLRVLRIEGIGVTDDFFDIGGASIQSIDIATFAQQAGFSLTSEQIFEQRTVRALAKALDANEQEAS